MRARLSMIAMIMTAAALWTGGIARADEHHVSCAPATSHSGISLVFDGTAVAAPGALGMPTSVSFLPPASCGTASPGPRPDLHLDLAEMAAAAAEGQAPPARAFVYSEAYERRARLHKQASYAMLPLFITEAVLGQKLFNKPSDTGGGKRTAHKAIGIAIGGLFAVNTTTGVMNLWEGRKDPQGLIRRTIHGTLMMVADLGFLATAATRPNSRTAEGLLIYDAKKNQHMAIAYASVTVATAGYLMMLFHH